LQKAYALSHVLGPDPARFARTVNLFQTFVSEAGNHAFIVN
jgi:hypothetical protein